MTMSINAAWVVLAIVIVIEVVAAVSLMRTGHDINRFIREKLDAMPEYEWNQMVNSAIEHYLEKDTTGKKESE